MIEPIDFDELEEFSITLDYEDGRVEEIEFGELPVRITVLLTWWVETQGVRTA